MPDVAVPVMHSCSSFPTACRRAFSVVPCSFAQGIQVALGMYAAFILFGQMVQVGQLVIYL